MATTPNINLSLTASSEAAKLFKDWRLSIDGQNQNSNMEKIDTAFGDTWDAIGYAIEEVKEYTDGAIQQIPKWELSESEPVSMQTGDIWYEIL